ncbi:non-ribosomal peptide synthetase, partial [Nostoc sp. CCY 9925]|uniref:non-ribosomal peptide synthetase n=1 Tax=Nostoc sp. CCY 9925 TaxID=3103865 RepID=UPI0039C6CBC3
MVHQGSVINCLASIAKSLHLSAADILVAVTSICFDIAALELLLPLSIGVKVVLAARDLIASGTNLSILLVSSGATIIQATPSTYHLLLKADKELLAKHQLRKVLCGGEPLSASLAQELLAYPVELFNLYGPTETTIWSSIHQVKETSGNIAIGPSFANTQFYILDSHLQPVPIGVPGELHIGGVGVARGYFNRPELTVEKFIPNPFSTEPGTRLYKTGDLTRYLPDGTIEFLGRTDYQVKLRGFRIELREIEMVLNQHPAVRETIVLASEDTSLQKRLVAYVVFHQKQVSTSSELSSFLREKLPNPMVPSTFVFLDNLPLTPNNKVNRKALLDFDCSQPELEETFLAPRTPLEHALAEIWSEVLEVKTFGVNDNFFELGGDSILGIQIIS